MTQAAAVLDLHISEKAWREHVVALAKWAGWRCYFTWRSTHSPAGFPDLVLLRPAEDRMSGLMLIFAELKTETGRLTVEQRGWLSALAVVAGCSGGLMHVDVWRPSDRDRILELLQSGGG